MPIRVIKSQKHANIDPAELAIFKPNTEKVCLSPKTELKVIRHQEAVDACRACNLSRDPRLLKRPTWRGTLPCQVLFIGEAPGSMENEYGDPFLGPAGQCLNEIIEESIKPFVRLRGPIPIAFTNVVKCMPFADNLATANSQKVHRPPKAHECRTCVDNHLVPFIQKIAKPDIIILVGKIAEAHVPQFEHIAYRHIVHPSYIIARSQDPRGDKIKCLTTIQEVLSERGVTFG